MQELMHASSNLVRIYKLELIFVTDVGPTYSGIFPTSEFNSYQQYEMCLLQQKKCAEECHRNKFDKSSGQQLLLVQHFVKVYKGFEGLEKNTKTKSF